MLFIAWIDESGGLNIQESNLLIPPISGVYNFSIITPPGEGGGGCMISDDLEEQMKSWQVFQSIQRIKP